MSRELLLPVNFLSGFATHGGTCLILLALLPNVEVCSRFFPTSTCSTFTHWAQVASYLLFPKATVSSPNVHLPSSRVTLLTQKAVVSLPNSCASPPLFSGATRTLSKALTCSQLAGKKTLAFTQGTKQRMKQWQQSKGPQKEGIIACKFYVGRHSVIVPLLSLICSLVFFLL